MTIELANRLIEFRKRFNFSQEELGEKLNVSRQSISKWESGEVSPSIDYIKDMARLYNVSVDDLINTNKTVEECYAKEEKKEKVHMFDSEGIHIHPENGDSVDISKKGIFVNGKSVHKKDYKYNHDYGFCTYKVDGDDSLHIINKIDKDSSFDMKAGIIEGICFGLLLLTYLLLGFLFKGVPNPFAVFWPILFLADVIPSIVRAVYYREFCQFGIWSIALASFLLIGMWGTMSGSFNGWHPYWVIIVAFPIYYIIFGNVDKAIRLSRYNKLMKTLKNDNVVFDSCDENKKGNNKVVSDVEED